MSVTEFMMDKVLYEKFTNYETARAVDSSKEPNVYLTSATVETEVRKFVPRIGGDIQVRLYFTNTSASAETVAIKVYSGNEVLLETSKSLKANASTGVYPEVTVTPFSTIRVTVSGSNKVQLTTATISTYVTDITTMYIVDV